MHIHAYTFISIQEICQGVQGWCFQKGLSFSSPIGSMYGILTYTFAIEIKQMYVNIPVPWILWVMTGTCEHPVSFPYLWRHFSPTNPLVRNSPKWSSEKVKESPRKCPKHPNIYGIFYLICPVNTLIISMFNWEMIQWMTDVSQNGLVETNNQSSSWPCFFLFGETHLPAEPFPGIAFGGELGATHGQYWGICSSAFEHEKFTRFAFFERSRGFFKLVFPKNRDTPKWMV